MSSDQPYVPEWTYDEEAGAGYLRLRPDRVTSSEAAGSAPHVVDLTLTKTVGIEFYDSEDAALIDRFLARVRRDAAREALDELAANFDRMGDAANQDDQWAWEWQASDEVKDYRDTHYPEETP